METSPDSNTLMLPDTAKDTAVVNVAMKVHSRCQLACNYCYMYEMADQSWRGQPRQMSQDTVAQTGERIAEHAETHNVPQINVVLHGGEPLLAPPEFFDSAAMLLRGAIRSDTLVEFWVQTNGLRLSKEYLEVFARHAVGVGISLDGGKEANNRHRTFRDGRGSFAQIADNINTMRGNPRWRRLFIGFLAVIDLRNDPLQAYEDLVQFEPPSVDFLLPHGNWNERPPGRTESFDDTPYADWLIPIFDRWVGENPQRTRIRTFDSILSLLGGGPSFVEALGPKNSKRALVTIETDGSIERVDTLKSTEAGATKTGMHINTHTFDDALRDPGIQTRLLGVSALSKTCQTCPVVGVCGGGYVTHRFSKNNGFDNPSVYCPDLTKLIAHVRGFRSKIITEAMVREAIGKHYSELAARQPKDGRAY